MKRMQIEKHQHIEQCLQRDQVLKQRGRSVLILGSANSGKKTFKSLMLRHDLDSRDGNTQRKLVMAYLVKCLLYCYRQLRIHNDHTYHTSFPNEFEHLEIELRISKRQGYLTLGVANFMKYLKQHQDEFLTFTAHHVRYMNNIMHFMNDEYASMMSRPSWKPSIVDLLKIKMPSPSKFKSIVEYTSEFDGIRFKFIDPNEQEGERRKFISLFQGAVDSVLYFVSLSDYNMLDSTSGKNLLDIAFSVAQQVVSSDYFQASLVLFLTKSDDFKEKLTHYPFTLFFPDFTGNEHDSAQCLEFLKSRFLMGLDTRAPRVYFHVVNLCDTHMMNYVMQAFASINLCVIV
ncbi:hypothetical protein C9374_010133 [Naegleria lovaniensis]|uniref:Uncharacterized protein n=1 Tax=Naegleria lovaniensis TaxID=51637 RepID=A0AA88GH15_NAELO|nr:uncharacterized protein C9374_010133 [Naegleria lovaniensis]KAG2375129.1 hypothetical protein C9374_010133 [Naegleria lovaniensis]